MSAAYINALGTSDENIQLLLRGTARIAFLIFLLVFVASPLQQLLSTDLTNWLLSERRSFGLAFATVHLLHATLIFYLADTSASFAFEFPKHLFGSGVYLLIVLMVITSFDERGDPDSIVGLYRTAAIDSAR